MAEHEQGAQIGVEVAALDRTEFDYFMGRAQRLGMVDHWPVPACEVHAARWRRRRSKIHRRPATAPDRVAARRTYEPSPAHRLECVRG